MLVLTRKVGESIRIGNDVTVANELSAGSCSSAGMGRLTRDKLENAIQARITIRIPSSTTITFPTFVFITLVSFR